MPGTGHRLLQCGMQGVDFGFPAHQLRRWNQAQREVARPQLLVPVAPAQPGQVVHQPFGTLVPAVRFLLEQAHDDVGQPCG